MKKMNILLCKAIGLLLLLVAAYTANAQPAWSRGIQTLTVTHEEGMKRAERALLAEGYTIQNRGGDFFGALKGIHTAIIACNTTSDGKAYINIVIASTSNDGNVPGQERVNLQKRMDIPSSTSTPPLPPNNPNPNAVQGNWGTQANGLGGKPGDRFTIYFPPNGTLSGRIWGTGIYTDDGSIATAAVHAGLSTVQNGGTVTIELRPGQPSYTGTVKNGVTSNNYGAFSGSFVFVGDNAGQVTPPPPPANTVQANWGTQADAYRGKNGQRFTFYFPPGGAQGRLWGTDTYTDDSSIGSAAVHAGVISFQNGGTVTIEIRAGQPSYQGTARNGANSASYGGWSGSFVIVR
jgi:hypothetical protein